MSIKPVAITSIENDQKFYPWVRENRRVISDREGVLNFVQPARQTLTDLDAPGSEQWSPFHAADTPTVIHQQAARGHDSADQFQ